jgi:putative ABC transport system permease protein
LISQLKEVLSRNRGCFFIALANLTQHRLRLLVALAGTAVPIILLIMQLGFLSGARAQVTRFYESFNFDIVVISANYQFLIENGEFDRVRLTQAKALSEVAETFEINIENTRWTNKATESDFSTLVFGLDENMDFIADPLFRRGLAALGANRSILVDEYSQEQFGSLAIGTEAEISGIDVTIAEHFQLGLFFYSDGSTIVKNTDYPRYIPSDPLSVDIGLIQLVPNANQIEIRDQLIALLPDDVRVLTHDELIAVEQDFFITTKPIGIMLQTSMWIAFLVGSVILLQVISTDVVNRLKEFATLKAMGFGPEFVFGIGLFQALLLASGAFAIALIVSSIILGIVASITHLPTTVTLLLAAVALLIVLMMSVIAVASVFRRISHADPAELY